MAASYQVTAQQLRQAGPDQVDLHAQASQIRQRHFGRRVFLRGVVEASNFCRENCTYCGMRRENRSLDRFRARHDELAELLIHHRPASITDLNIQTGEDPVAVREVVLPLLQTLRQHTNLGLSVCLGTLKEDLYQALQSAGASIYIMKFEIALPNRYEELQAPGSLQERVDHIHHLAQSGWHVSSGFIAGLPGQSEHELLADFELARQLPLLGCSVSPFIPGESTPFHDAQVADLDLTLNCMAALRLLQPHWVIPAVSALNLAANATPELDGYRRGLRTGANLVTMNLTPSSLRDEYLLYKRDRFIMTEERILKAIDAEGLTPSRQSLANHCQSQSARRNAAPASWESERVSTVS